MAHELDFTKGKAAIAYRSAVPWHGHGELITPDMSLDDMIKAACLDYTVEPALCKYTWEKPLTNGDSESVDRLFNNRVVLHRSDNGMALSVMSENKYEIRQPRDIVDFFRALCDFGGMEIETLGALREGRNVWALAAKKDNVFTLDKDSVKPYIALNESYDGSIATTATPTSVVEVCANTMRAVLADKKAHIKVPHCKTFDAEGVKAALAESDEQFAAYFAKVKALSKVKVSDDTLLRYFARVVAPESYGDQAALDNWTTTRDFDIERKVKKKGEDKPAVTSNAKNVVAALLEAAQPGNSPGSDYTVRKGTAWGALNAVTYYTDHLARTKGNKRWESAMIGNGANTKAEAFDVLCQMFAPDLAEKVKVAA